MHEFLPSYYRYVILFLLIFEGLQRPFFASAQPKYNVSGYVTDAETGESLLGAAVFVKGNNQLGVSANAYGYYSLLLPQGAYTIVAQFVGYQHLEQQVTLNANQKLNFKLKPTAAMAQEIEVTAGRRPEQNVQSTEMGTVELKMDAIRTLPVLMGEVDVLKTIQLLPGVASGGEGNTSFYVRGGGADQNLVLLDEGVIYNPGHLFNFFSVFNSDAINSINLIKGNMPARYGGRLSSVLDITMKEGNNQKVEAEGGIGLIASRLTVQGPLQKDKSSFIISGRRTYIDVLAHPFLKNNEQGGLPYYFYDLNAKLNYRISDKDRIFLSGYFGRDVASFTFSDGRFTSDIFWGNATGTLRWNHLFSDKLFLNTSLNITDYNFTFDSEFDIYRTKVTTGLRDYSAKLDFDYYPGIRHNIQFGAHYTYHKLTPRRGEARSDEGEAFSTDKLINKFAHEAAAYVSDDYTISDKLKLNAGLRLSYFQQTGPYHHYLFNDRGTADTVVTYNKGQKVKDFSTLEPRLALRYNLTSASSVKAGYSYNAQYLHLVSNAYTSLPLDVWVPSTAIVNPQRGSQYALGYFRNFADNRFETSVEAYYKNLDNQIEYSEDYVAGPTNTDLEYSFVFGKGRSYGLEFFVRKNDGKTTGWVGYTWSRTTRQFPDLNDGNPFPARFDRRHDLSLVASHELNKNWTFGGTFVYGTGQAMTIPVRRYVIEGNVSYDYGKRNDFWMEAFHRLDLSATYTPKNQKRVESSWVFAIYNVYSRQNPFFYYVDNEGNAYDNTLQIKAKKVSLIPIPIPSVTWNFKW